MFFEDLIVFAVFLRCFIFLRRQVRLKQSKLKKKIPLNLMIKDIWWNVLFFLNFLEIIFKYLTSFIDFNQENSPLLYIIYRNIWTTLVFYLLNGMTFLKLLYILKKQRKTSSHLTGSFELSSNKMT